MKIKGLDGRSYNFNPKFKKPSEKCSKLHYRTRKLLQKIFPCDTIYEEVSLPGSRSYRRLRILKADFFVMQENLIVECDGQQHYKKTYYHKTQLEFLESQSNDRDKENWCSINGLYFIRLRYDETNKEWEKKIRNRI